MNTEKAMKDLLKMKEFLDGALQQCQSLSGVMKQEHKAMSEHQIDQVEAVVSQKEEVAGALKEIVQGLYESLMSLGEGSLPERVELSLGLEIFDTLKASLDKSDIRANALCYLIDECQTLMKAVLAKAEQVRYEIHQNMLVLEKMVANHQESYRFWQTIGAEEGAQYDETGERQASGHCSQLIVKV